MYLYLGSEILLRCIEYIAILQRRKVSRYIHVPDHKTSYDDTSSAAMNHGFYAFEDEDFPTSGRSEQTHVRAEVFRYLDDPRKDFAMLQDFPAIKSVFVHYNTNLCSSAPVERLFSFASLELRPNRRRLEDSLFEKLLLLKCN